MEKRERFVIEVLLGAVLIVLLVLLAFLVTGFSSNSDSNEGSTTVINSYNTHITSPKQTTKPYVVDGNTRVHIDSRAKIYYTDNDLRYAHRIYDDNHLRFHDFGERQIVRGLFGNDIDNYVVYLKNREHAGGWFTVNFHFEDYYGRENSHSVRHYVRPHEEQKFVFRDISFNDDEYRRWWYEVKSHSKKPVRVYYN